MADAATLRRLALALPGAVEQDHHGRPSFRVAGRIFATLWDPAHANVILDEPGIITAVQNHPRACTEFWWGKRLAAVHVDLQAAGDGLLGELLADAWERRSRLLVARRDGVVGLTAQDEHPGSEAGVRASVGSGRLSRIGSQGARVLRSVDDPGGAW